MIFVIVFAVGWAIGGPVGAIALTLLFVVLASQ